MSNVLITGESNFDEKNVKEVFNLCSTEESCIHIGITCYKIGTLDSTPHTILVKFDNRLRIFDIGFFGGN